MGKGSWKAREVSEGRSRYRGVPLALRSRFAMFRNAEHYFAKAIILASRASLVNKVNPDATAGDLPRCRKGDRRGAAMRAT
jgi:hypothetical protein